METAKLKKFAQAARRGLREQVSTRLKSVLSADSMAKRENPKAVAELEKQIKERGKDQVVEAAAYVWFNRFCALRFMDANNYTRIRVVSPVPGQFQPEILAEAKMGHIDDDLGSVEQRQRILDILSSERPDAQGEAYRLLLVAACNAWNKAMPFLFEKIADYTELLLPDDLLSGNSILAYTREALTPVACEDVEVIGWLYQFYISEKKGEVFEGLKKNKKITPDNIPAATQLFTPHWIVRYLVENSLGRLWMLNRPNSRLKDQMEYYIEPQNTQNTQNGSSSEFSVPSVVKEDFLPVNSPEELKICDPACGSGHMLTYAFDLLYAIYEEEGYEPSEIPEKILTHNLYGIEIDERAGELAAFALTMKARAKQRRFFSKQIKPNICVLENVVFDDGELKSYMDEVGRDLFSSALQQTVLQFDEADNFGSLIVPQATDVAELRQMLEAKDMGGNLLLHTTHKKVLQALEMADYLSPKYHVVVANPPYMGGKGMNGRLVAWLKDNYEDVKSDLFSAFVARCSKIGRSNSYIGIMSPNVWMYLSSHEKLRQLLTSEKTITSLVELPLTGFKGATVQICACTFVNHIYPNLPATFVRLVEFKGADLEMANFTRKAIQDPFCNYRFSATINDFKKIPGTPIVYWISDRMRKLFDGLPAISESLTVTGGMTTADNERFLRLWHEVADVNTFKNCADREEAKDSGKRWFPYNKGGSYRKWFGNRDYHVNWQNDGEEILSTGRAFPRSREYYFKESLTYTATSSSYFGIRYSDPGFLFDAKGSSCFADKSTLYVGLGFLASKIATYLLKCVNPTVEFQTGNISVLPFKNDCNVYAVVDGLIKISRSDWDAYETSWDFTILPVLNPNYRQPTLKAIYQKLRIHWREMTLEMQRLEEENNRIFIEAYGLQDELTPEVPLNEITLTCNPHYRYGSNKTDEELEALLLADTMREFISYAVGCMFGRYSLDKPGLILANQGETIEDYQKQVPNPAFVPDDDNVIPILEGDWFTDDAAERFRTFLRVTFGETHYEENLRFLEEAIGKDIEKYFLKDFYTDHVKRYKKRPIYWLFSSPKGSFNALIYMHRYRPDTVSVVLNDYLREFRTKLSAKLEHLLQVGASADASKSDKTKALKEIEKIKKILDELDTFEHEILYPLAGQQIEIDLDDGVKVNYPKFGKALKKVTGLSAK